MNSSASSEEHTTKVTAGEVTLEASLSIPAQADGIVVFAHGSGSSRFSPRNRFVAGFLNEGGLATLLCDLLTPPEEQIDRITRELRFDIRLLAERLAGVTEWLFERPELNELSIGYFGSSTGAAAALIAAAQRPRSIHAVVSRGGRPDLAMDALPSVEAPTLLIVGGLDEPVKEMNRAALSKLRCEKELEIVAGATHLFQEPGKLEAVAEIAQGWFQTHLSKEDGDGELSQS